MCYLAHRVVLLRLRHCAARSRLHICWLMRAPPTRSHNSSIGQQQYSATYACHTLTLVRPLLATEAVHTGTAYLAPSHAAPGYRAPAAP